MPDAGDGRQRGDGNGKKERELLKEHGAQIERLNKMVMNTLAVRQVTYAYRRLKALDLELTMDFMLEVECLTSALVTAYGRLFSETKGTTKLSPKIVPEELRAVHEEIMQLRHNRHAHHGAHDSIGTGMEFDVTSESVDLKLNIHMSMCLGAPAHWEPLVQWLDKFIVESVEGQLAHLTKVSGREWHWPGPPEYIE